MLFSMTAFFGFSIWIAGIIGIVRFNRINRTYYPFIFCVWIAGVNELLSYLLSETGHYTAANNNLYVLAEALLFSVFFKNLGLFKKFPKGFGIVMIGLLFLWSWENFVLGKITYISSWFRISYSFLIVLMSITAINKLVILEVNKPIEVNARHILKHPVFLVCIGSIVFFTYKVLVEIFWLYGLNSSKGFRIKVYDILVYINLAVNLIYALAVLWISPKQEYMTQ